MYLFIDTSHEEEIRLAVFDSEKKLAKKVMKVGFKYSEKILTGIDSVLKSAKQKLENLSGILVVEGPGRFSALRTGVSTANTLGFASNIKIFAIFKIEAEDYWTNVSKLVNNFKKLKSVKIVTPKYGQEPNITIKRKN